MTTRFTIAGVDEAGLGLVAEVLALSSRPGDVLALRGDLGTGKTTFARAFVRAVLDDPGMDVPSPTFTLLQTYETSRFPISHFDLYRVEATSELEELGFDEAVAGSVVLLEWPERAGAQLPPARLEIHLESIADPDLRTLHLIGLGDWAPRLDRIHAVHEFLVGHARRTGLAAWRLRYLQGDASPRAYARLDLGGSTRVLMNAPSMPDGPPVRDGLPYSRIAHLAEDVRPFVAVTRAIGERGLASPQVHAQDLAQGLLLLDDLGDLTLGRAVASGLPQPDLWRAAVDALIALRRTGRPPDALPLTDDATHALPAFDRRALSIEAELLVDWYWPAVKGQPIPVTARDEFINLWTTQFDWLVGLPKGWVLRDYHSPNLMWMPQNEGIARIGVLDFQDAMAGPWAYDLVSLLQDARLDVPAVLESELFDLYCDRVAAIEPDFDRTSFAHAYAALGAQRNTKILGIFARLARRDGKPVYLQHMPRIWRYLARDLAHPSLAPLEAWYDRHFPQADRTRVLAA
ncbi:MAG: tRNA (adenosine(37)-N6)-threonylcarbamoyltransferase complex ATPase subunit type 1 TsaE [Hyphomicrobiaceae bacterium]